MREVNRKHYIGDDGKSYTVAELKPVIQAEATDTRMYTGLGASIFRLADGGLLYDKSEDAFEIASTGVIIRPL